MKTVERSDWSTLLDSYARGAVSEPVVLTVDGRPVATLLPVEEADLESLAVAADPAFRRIIERSRARHEAEGSIELSDLRRELASSLASRRRARS